MKVEDLVCDLELAKKLKELGVKQESIYYWVDSTNTHERVFLSINQTWGDEEKLYIYAAFTTDELLEMLPDYIRMINGQIKFIYKLNIVKICNQYNVQYFNFGILNENIIAFTEKKLSNALAKLLIWCIENNYVEVEK